MPMPDKMPMSHRWALAIRILKGEFNTVNQTQTSLLEEITLRNRNKKWYENRDAGKYPWTEPDTLSKEESDG